jgi:GT2 family glycosyltransferase
VSNDAGDPQRPTRLSVVVPTRDRVALLAEAVASIRSATSNATGIEIVIVDDSPVRQAEAVAGEFDAIYVHSAGAGVSAARNAGVAASTADYVAFLDDDDVWVTGYPDAQMAVLDDRPDVVAVVSRIMMGDELAQPAYGPLPEQPLDHDQSMYEQFIRYVPGVASLVVRRRILDAVGGFDERLVGAEDWDLALRIADAGRVVPMPDVCMVVRQHAIGRAADLAGEYRVLRRRMRDTAAVLRRGVRRLPLGRQVRCVPVWIHKRGWWAYTFVSFGTRAWGSGERWLAARSMGVASVLSPPAVVGAALRSIRSRRVR